MVFDMITNAPGVLQSTLAVGTPAGPDGGGQRSEPDAGAATRRSTTSTRPRPRSGTSACSASCSGTSCSTWPTSASTSDNLLRQPQINAPAARCDVPGRQPGSDARPERDAGRDRAADRPAAALSWLRRHPHVGLQRVRQLPLAADRHQSPLRQRVDVLVLLRVVEGALHQQRRLAPPARRTSAKRRPAGSTTRSPTTIGRTTSSPTSSTRRRK